MIKISNSPPPLISIITVVLNAQSTLERTILSVANQDFDDFEYILIDGGSTDGTSKIIEKYEESFAYAISEPDKGIYDAMNKGISAASGSWLYFLGADDILKNGILSNIAKYLEDNLTVYYGNVYRPKANRIYDGKFSLYKLACRNICQQAIFYPKKVFDIYSYNLRYRLLSDYDLNLRCFSDKNFDFVYIPLVIAEFNDSFGRSVTGDEVFEKDRLVIIKSHFRWWIYIPIRFRFFMISAIQRLGFLRFIKTVYHGFLRIKSNFLHRV